MIFNPEDFDLGENCLHYLETAYILAQYYRNLYFPCLEEIEVKFKYQEQTQPHTVTNSLVLSTSQTIFQGRK